LRNTIDLFTGISCLVVADSFVESDHKDSDSRKDEKAESQKPLIHDGTNDQEEVSSVEDKMANFDHEQLPAPSQPNI
jgi:hypothetical protein